jgi:methionyl-tRNA formyltransferase
MVILKMNKVIFLVIGLKGYQVIKHAIENYRMLIDFVVYGSDSGVETDYQREIILLCLENKIPFFERNKSKKILEAYDNYIIAIGWRWMLPVSKKYIIIHDSLLPRYRGFAPLVNCLINGDSRIGATALFAATEYDKGEVILQHSLDIDYPIKINQAINYMSEIYVKLVDAVLVKIKNKEIIKGYLQDEHAATYSLWRDEQDYWIDWNLSAENIVRFINAVGHPYAGARCLLNGTEVVVESVIAISDLKIEDRKSSIGKVILIDDGSPVVVCVTGLLKIIGVVNIDGKSMLPLSKFRTRFSGKK